MESSEDKQWASKYLLDPLNAPEPADETGPGSHFNSTLKGASVTTYPTPPGSASPTQTTFSRTGKNVSHRQNAFAEFNGNVPTRSTSIGSSGSIQQHRRRGSSLGERFPGDVSHRPLDQLRKEARAADHASHLKKRHIPGTDIVDSLDDSIVGGPYHHGGPYDATLLARNTSYKSSPVEAVRSGNEEALRATPQELIQDSLTKHVPLQGTAVIPPGFRALSGQKMQYEEGADLMREEDAPGGAYKRLPGVKYLPGDLKGKGEPSYSLEKALKQNEIRTHRRVFSEGDSAYEMQSQARPSASRLRSQSGSGTGLPARPPGSQTSYAEFETDMRRSHSTGHKVAQGLKKRFGSLRRSKRDVET